MILEQIQNIIKQILKTLKTLQLKYNDIYIDLYGCVWFLKKWTMIFKKNGQWFKTQLILVNFCEKLEKKDGEHLAQSIDKSLFPTYHKR